MCLLLHPLWQDGLLCLLARPVSTRHATVNTCAHSLSPLTLECAEIMRSWESGGGCGSVPVSRLAARYSSCSAGAWRRQGGIGPSNWLAAKGEAKILKGGESQNAQFVGGEAEGSRSRG